MPATKELLDVLGSCLFLMLGLGGVAFWAAINDGWKRLFEREALRPRPVELTVLRSAFVLFQVLGLSYTVLGLAQGLGKIDARDVASISSLVLSMKTAFWSTWAGCLGALGAGLYLLTVQVYEGARHGS